jgi:hypothetical protein
VQAVPAHVQAVDGCSRGPAPVSHPDPLPGRASIVPPISFSWRTFAAAEAADVSGRQEWLQETAAGRPWGVCFVELFGARRGRRADFD